MDVELDDSELQDTDEFADLNYNDHEKMIESKLYWQPKQIQSMSSKNKIAKNGMRTLYPNRRKKI